MPQLFVNNIDTVLTDALGTATVNEAQVMTVDDAGSWPVLLWPDDSTKFFLVTLTDNTDFEVVKVSPSSDYTTTTRMVIRGQENTTPRAWPAGTRVIGALTAGTMSRMLVQDPMPDRTTTPGEDAIEFRTGFPRSSGPQGAEGVRSLAIGYRALAVGEGGVALGGAEAAGQNSVAVGTGTYVDAAAVGGMALGLNAAAFLPATFNITGMPITQPPEWWWGDGWVFQYQSTLELIGTTEILDLTQAQVYTPSVPTGATLFLSEVGLIITSADGVTTHPTVRFGINGAPAGLVAATLLSGLGAAGKRVRFTELLTDDGATALTVEITSGGAATSMMGRFYWKGFAILNEGYG